jgi:hypothetical protein
MEATEAALAADKGEDRDPVHTAKCKAAFEALSAKMRFIKERFIFVPPLPMRIMSPWG